MTSPKELFYDAIYKREFVKAQYLLEELRGKSKERGKNYLEKMKKKAIKKS